MAALHDLPYTTHSIYSPIFLCSCSHLRFLKSPPDLYYINVLLLAAGEVVLWRLLATSLLLLHCRAVHLHSNPSSAWSLVSNHP